ncbi:MAG: cyclohexanecarboxyl-CoA dehydrogenase [Actinomycetia bacterium]|nr:cyclohexanecarboxyl-CoA dehydrogenase [Actinomycetes bacterium]
MIFDDEQQQFADTLRSFARRRLKDQYARWETEPVDAGLIEEIASLGATGLLIAEEYGGSAAGYVACGIASEELSRGDFNVSGLVQLSAIVGAALNRWGSDSVKAEWLPRIAEGSAVAALALTEPDAGSDAAAITTRAARSGGGWVLSGEKASTTFAGYAAGAIVMVRTGGPGPGGVSAFWVPLDQHGVTRQVYDSLGGKFTARGSLVFDDVFVPDDHVLGELGSGFVQAMMAFDFNRAVIGLGAVGSALESLEETIEYTKQRSTFGQPLSSRQAVSQQIAEHYSKLNAARLMGYHALELADLGRGHTAEAAMAKWMGPAWSVEAIHACLRLHGWSGYGEDLPFAQRMRDAIGLEIGDGTPEIMKAIVARELFGTATHR